MALLLTLALFLFACGAVTLLIFAPRSTKPLSKDVEGVYLGGDTYVHFK